MLAAQGGHIWADNPAGGGARFTMRVPVDGAEGVDGGEADARA
jgi:signal transduction histidine kinase